MQITGFDFYDSEETELNSAINDHGKLRVRRQFGNGDRRRPTTTAATTTRATSSARRGHRYRNGSSG